MSRAAAIVFGRSVLCDQECFTAGKHRRTGEFPPIILQIFGNDCKVVDRRKKWVLNERTKTIDPAHEAHRFEDATSGKEHDNRTQPLTPQQRRLVRQSNVESSALSEL